MQELESLEKGGTMWEAGSKEKQNKKGLLGDIFNVLKAFSGGAHIEKNKFGETWRHEVDFEHKLLFFLENLNTEQEHSYRVLKWLKIGVSI